MKKILLLGANGQLGHELARCLAPLGRLQATTRQGHDGAIMAELGDLEGLSRLLQQYKPDLIVNAAAYTAVDQAEQEQQLAHRINAEAPALLARFASERDIPLLHYSTDYVFDGKANQPYTESDPTAPATAYGRSKLAGEQAIIDSSCHHLIFRSAWIYAHRGHNFLRSILRAASQQPQLRVVNDQQGTPTWARMLAQLSAAAYQRVELADAWPKLSGIYHLSSTGPATNWWAFASAFVDIAVARDIIQQRPEILPIGSAEYPTPTDRPSYSVLDNRRFQRAFGLHVPSWESQLQQCMEDFHPPYANAP